jgi:hypothetical protein
MENLDQGVWSKVEAPVPVPVPIPDLELRA